MGGYEGMARVSSSDPQDRQLISTAVIREVAAREGVDPTELSTPLYDVVDPDALDSLVRSTQNRGEGAGLQIRFRYCDYVVRVDGSGTVTVREQED